MRDWLVVAREVQIDIGNLIALKAKEGLERNVVTIFDHQSTALGTVFVRHIKARAVLTFCVEMAVLTVGTAIVRRKGIDFRDP